MRHIILSLCVGSAALSAGCARNSDEAEVARALKDLNVVDDAGLNDVMAQAADPREAVAYFRKAVADNPDRIDLKRGLGGALVRAKQHSQAAVTWAEVAAHPEAGPVDREALADAQIRAGDWAAAKATLNAIPPTHETYRRYRLEAMVADSEQDWARADSFYQTATGLTTRPAAVLNNWGFSKLTRGEHAAAERLFGEALSHDSSLFTAKNNMVLARGAQRQYDLPVVPMSQVERAQLLHTLALTAIKQGDTSIGQTLLSEAVDTHPQHFDAAARALEALETG